MTKIDPKNHRGPKQTIQYQTIGDDTGPYGTIWTIWEHRRLYETIEDQRGPYINIRDNKGLCRTNNIGLSNQVTDRPGP